MSLIYAYKSRGITKDISILNGCGAEITPSSLDIIKVKISREGTLDTSPLLTITSSTPTANGSAFTKNTPRPGKHRLRLDSRDLTFPAGIYTLSVELVDHQDNDEIKEANRVIFNLAET